MLHLQILRTGAMVTVLQGGYTFVNKHRTKNTNRTTGEFLVQFFLILLYFGSALKQRNGS
jgi:hypothetical protein